MTETICGTFVGEIFVGLDGEYLGGFHAEYLDHDNHDTFGNPLGWVHCMADCEGASSPFRDFYDTPCTCGDGYPNRPRAGIPFEFPTQRLTVITDFTGPLGLETEHALQIDGSGAGDAAVAWVGPQMYDPVTELYKFGLLDNDPDTGWRPQEGESWTFQCWAKVVPDYEDFVPDDTQLGFTAAKAGLSTGTVDERTTISSDDWTFVQSTFTWIGGDTAADDFVFPVLEIHGADWTRREPRTIDVGGTPVTTDFYIERGRLLIKCAHLYPTPPPPAGGPKPVESVFYDESVPIFLGGDYVIQDNTNPTFGSVTTNVGMQFLTEVPGLLITGIQFYVPVSDLMPTTTFVRLWRGGYLADDILLRRQEVEIEQGAWNNVFWEEGPYLADNEFFTVAWQTMGYYIEHDYAHPPETHPWFPAHDKGDFRDNSPGGSFGIQRFGDLTRRGPEHTPNFNNAGFTFCGPVINFTPAALRGIDISFTDGPFTTPVWTQVDDAAGI